MTLQLRIFYLLTCLCGIVLLLFATGKWGIGYDPDSIIYEDVAQNWLAGQGISRFDFATGESYPLTNFPPLYPLTLAILSQITGTIAQAARILNIALWVILWLMTAAWIQKYRPSPKIAWLGANLLMFNFYVLQVYGTSWSEPLFMALAFSGLWLFVSYHQQDKQGYLVAASALIGLAILTRYAGLALLGTIILILIFQREKTIFQRLRALLIAGLVSGLPLLLWFLRNLSLSGDVANRALGIHPPALPQLESTLQTLANFLLPFSDMTINIITLFVILFLLIIAYRQLPSESQSLDFISRLLTLWIVIYMLFILASFTFADARIPFNYRILIPAYVALLIIIARWIAHYSSAWGRGLRLVWIIAGVSVLILNGIMALVWTNTIANYGHQYSSRIFQESQIIADLQDLPPEVLIVTNNNFLFHYLTDHPAQLVPFPSESGVDKWLNDMAQNKVDTIWLVYFRWLGEQGWSSAQEIESMLPLTLIASAPEVNLYQVDLPHAPID